MTKTSIVGYVSLRKKLDEMGYYQSLLPESVPLVSALLHDLIASKDCSKESIPNRIQSFSSDKFLSKKTSNQILENQVVIKSEAEIEKKQIFDLSLLNASSLSMIQKLQEESAAKSRKILQLEAGKARVVSKGGPKLELKSFVSFPPPFRSVSSTPQQEIDLITIYEVKQNQLLTLNRQREKDLEIAQRRILELEESISKSIPSETNHNLPDPTSSSSYILKLLKDNAELKDKLSHGLRCPIHGNKKDEEKHESKIQRISEIPFSSASLRIQELEENKKRLETELKRMKKRLEDLQSVKNSYKEKVERLSKVNGLNANINGIVNSMEKERNDYKIQVQSLLKELEEKTNDDKYNKKENKESDTHKKIKESCSLCCSLEKEKKDLWTQNQILNEDNKRLLEVRSKIEMESSSSSSFGDISAKYSDSLKALEKAEKDLKLKDSHLQLLSSQKDSLLEVLDEKTLEIERFKKTLSESTREIQTYQDTQKKNFETSKETEKLLLEIKSLNDSHESLTRELTGLKSRNKDLRIENNSLKSSIVEKESELSKSGKQIAEIKNSINRYVNEVKRFEEMLSICEKERTELLMSYKHLSNEMSSSESQNRKVLAQSANLQMELMARDEEIKALELRLLNLEKDLAETSLSNENYRLQLASLSAKADITESQLQESRNHQNWMNSDLTDVHELAIQLNSQKMDLLDKISAQNDEIASMTKELQRLRSSNIHAFQVQDSKSKSFER